MNPDYSVRGLALSDLESVEKLDELSGDGVSQWVGDLEEDEVSDYAWGLFYKDELIGYCTTGEADDDPGDMQKHPGYDNMQLILSDVYVKPEYRKQGLGTYMCVTAMHNRFEIEGPYANYIYATLLYDELIAFYGEFGFDWIDGPDYAIVASKEDINIAYEKLQQEGMNL